jgi:phosphatidylglycerophosphatase A
LSKRITLKNKFCLVFATLFGIGYIPLFPGTASSLVAVFIFFLIKNKFYFFIFTLISFALSFSLTGYAERIFKEKDCKKIVIDDFSGMLLSLLFIPQNLKLVIFGFFIFRTLDFLKIPPANKLEKFNGAVGISGDDLVAGIYTNIILHSLRLFLKISS